MGIPILRGNYLIRIIHRRGGRVEGGTAKRCPVLPPRTGRADFPHPALMVSFVLTHSWAHPIGVRHSLGLGAEGVLPGNSDLGSSCFRAIPSGSLGSTGITPLHRYYGPIRLLACHAGWLCLPIRRPRLPAGTRGLSVPDLVFRHAPSPSTPES